MFNGGFLEVAFRCSIIAALGMASDVGFWKDF
jgi:hypothetical protein